MQQEPSVDELLSRLVKLEAENRALKKQREKFGLTFRRYPEEGEAQFLLNGMVPYLTRIDSHCVVKEDPQNAEHILIEGDNISALVALQSTHKGKVDVIYIDPPYNTGNKDFVYNDRYVSNDDGFRHSKWLSFMERRLHLAKELLSETGVIFVSIDDNEQAALKLLMDQVFGTGSVEQMIWHKVGDDSGRMKVTHRFRREHEYILVAYNNLSSTRFSKYEAARDYKNSYTNPDNDPRGPYKQGIISHTESKSRPHGKNFFHVTTPSGRVVSRQWRVTEEEFSALVEDGRIYFGKNGDSVPSLKVFINETKMETPMSILRDLGTAKTAGKSVEAMLGEGRFSYPKPVELVKRLLQISTSQNAIVLDFFAGSGTTGHAVAALNAEDGGNRQCILVTNNFEQDGSPNGIARDVTAARMKAVLTGQWADGKDHEALPGNLHYYKIDFKKPVTNMISNAQIMQSRFAGLAALSTGAHVRVEADEVPASATKLRDALDAEEAVLLRGKDNLVLVWQDYDLLLDEPERVQDILEEVDGLNAALETPLERIIYVPFDAEDTRDEFDFEGWEVVSFPVRYLREVANTVDMLVKSDLLLPLEATPADEEGDEGTTGIESDDPTASSGSLRASDD